jgi:hypothetical protein
LTTLDELIDTQLGRLDTMIAALGKRPEPDSEAWRQHHEEAVMVAQILHDNVSRYGRRLYTHNGLINPVGIHAALRKVARRMRKLQVMRG